MKIIVQAYDPSWSDQFESLREVLLQHLPDKILGIEHVGSTSVPGMSAKPIIDLDIIIDNDSQTLKTVIDILNTIGYLHVGEMGISGREAFKRSSSRTPITDAKKEWFDHNLYVCKKGSIGLNNHLALKKHLLNNPLKVIQYSKLKHKLADKFPNDIDAYIDGKTDFILDILKKEGISSSDTQIIETQNKIQDK